ncbi:hypothetical protein HK096_004597 [Nowakowskiella sp. JEL0078]|nr:hypothetical protein HK096_004597 [Nowakowskiella sp. JEL0078]
MFPTSAAPVNTSEDDGITVDGETPKRKIVFVGDSGVGKTSSIFAIRNGGILPGQAPRVFQNADKLIIVSPGYDVLAFLCDTAGDDFDGNNDATLQVHHIRPEAYKHAHVVAILFSLVDRKSFEHVTSKWLPEVKKYAPKARILLVGTKKDLRVDVSILAKLKLEKDTPVSSDEGMDIAAVIDADDYCEITCNSNDFQGIDEFEKTVGAAAMNAPEESSCSIM